MRLLLCFLLCVTALGQAVPPNYPYSVPLQTSGSFPGTTIKLTGVVNPTGYNDPRPAMWDIVMGGGYRAVSSVAERDSINASRRKEGMFVLTVDTTNMYRLNSTLTNWIDLGNPDLWQTGGGGGSFENVAITDLVWNTNHIHDVGGFYNIFANFDWFGIQAGRKIDLETTFAVDDELIIGGRNLNINGTVFHETSASSFQHLAAGPYTVLAPGGDIEINSTTTLNSGFTTRIIGERAMIGDDRQQPITLVTNAYFAVGGSIPSGTRQGASIYAPAGFDIAIGEVDFGLVSGGYTNLERGTVLGRDPSLPGNLSYMQMDYRGLAWSSNTSNMFWASNTIPYFHVLSGGNGPQTFPRVHLNFAGTIGPTNFAYLRVGESASGYLIRLSDGQAAVGADLYPATVYTLIFKASGIGPNVGWFMQGPGYHDVPVTSYTPGDPGADITPANTTTYIIDGSQPLTANRPFSFNTINGNWYIKRGKIFEFYNYDTTGFTADFSYFDGSDHAVHSFTTKTWGKFVWTGTNFMTLSTGTIP